MTLPFVQMNGERPWPPRITEATRPFWQALEGGKFMTTRGKSSGQLVLSSLRHPKDKSPDLAFLLKSLKNLLAGQREKELALKRGAGRTPIPLDLDTAERGYAINTSHALTPEVVFEKRWAATLLRWFSIAVRWQRAPSS